ncbi:MAG: CAP domain-containing protein [Chloroflexota bacterium]
MIVETQRTRISRRVGTALLGAALATALVVPGVLATSRPGAQPQAATTAIDYPYAPWLTDEAFYLKMYNCTRTGGWVTSTGSCTAYGSGRYSAYVRPIVRSGALSDLTARPYAKVLAVRNLCGHNYDGSLTTRLARAGFRGSAWGENLACRGGMSVRASIIWAHRVFQSERSYNGPHWKNIKNRNFTQIGIGIWRNGDRVRLVTDFFRP